MIDKLPKGEGFNSQYFGQNALDGLDANLRPGVMGKPILIHMNNASPHRSKETLTSMKDFNFHAVPYPAFSLDLALSDFYLSGIIKRRLRGRSFQDTDELVEAVSEESSFIRPSELHAVFQNWEDRL
jgi:transposase